MDPKPRYNEVAVYLWTLPIQGANQAHPYHSSHILSKSSCTSHPCHPPHFYRPTPNHFHSYLPHAQTTSIYQTSLPQPRSEHPKDYTRPHFASYLSETHHTSISPSYAVLPRLCRFSAFIAHVSVSLCQHTLETGPKNLSLYVIGCTMVCQNGIVPWT